MSAINVTQTEAELILVSLNMYAKMQLSASGVIPADLDELIQKLTPAPEVVAEPEPVATAVVEPEPVVEAPEVHVEETAPEAPAEQQ